jgi:exopolysaccharide biosynthesis polyprenyl glycosylphosphotransferase
MFEHPTRVTVNSNAELAPQRFQSLGSPSTELEAQQWMRPWRDPLFRRVLAIADGISAVVICLSLAVFSPEHASTAVWAAMFAPLWLLLAKLHGLYDLDHRSLRHLTVDELPNIFMWATTGTFMLSLLLALTPAGTPSTAIALRIWVFAGVSAFTLRSTVRFIWRRLTPPERTLLVGSGPLLDATRRKVELFPDIHVEVVDVREALTADDLRDGAPAIFDVERVIVATNTLDEGLIAALVTFCRKTRIKLSIVPPARGMFGTAVHLYHIADLPVVEYSTWDVSRSTLMLKRTFDVAVSLIAAAVLLPLFVAVVFAVACDGHGRSIVFAQRRAGLRGKTFMMLKFRTMILDAEAVLEELIPFDDLREPMFKLRDDPRVTRVGRVLRRLSLDELPQFVNVLKGEMSLVGPRPEQVELVARYAPEHRFRLDVKPGITGPMQVYGRGKLSFEERLAVERDYIENLSLRRDLRILALTASAVVTGRGAY